MDYKGIVPKLSWRHAGESFEYAAEIKRIFKTDQRRNRCDWDILGEQKVLCFFNTERVQKCIGRSSHLLFE